MDTQIHLEGDFPLSTISLVSSPIFGDGSTYFRIGSVR